MKQSSSPAWLLEESFLAEVTRIARSCARILIVAEEEDDLVQDVVLECLMNLRSAKPVVPLMLESYVMTMMKRRATNALRSTQRRDARALEFTYDRENAMPAWMSPDQCNTEEDYEQIIDTIVASLSPRRREVFTLIRDEHASYKTVATTLGISRAAVSNHVARLQKQLREALREHDIIVPGPRPACASLDAQQTKRRGRRAAHNAARATDAARCATDTPDRQDDLAA